MFWKSIDIKTSFLPLKSFLVCFSEKDEQSSEKWFVCEEIEIEGRKLSQLNARYVNEKMTCF